MLPLAWILILMIAMIPIAIAYFIIKLAVKNAIREIIEEYKQTTKTTNTTIKKEEPKTQQ